MNKIEDYREHKHIKPEHQSQRITKTKQQNSADMNEIKPDDHVRTTSTHGVAENKKLRHQLADYQRSEYLYYQAVRREL